MKTFRLLLLLGLLLTLSSCFVGRMLIWNKPKPDDFKHFPAREIKMGSSAFHFVEKSGANPVFREIPMAVNPTHLASLEDILRSDKTTAMLIIRNDTIRYEQYFDGWDKTMLMNSLSISKSFVSLLLGIAISEGYIKNEAEPITRFVPELKAAGFDKICLADLLNMRSGIKFNNGWFIPYTNEATYYYGRDLMLFLKHLRLKEPAGVHFEYKSVNTQLLSLAIARATHRSLSAYLQEKLWIPLGMESDASWSVFDRDSIERSFCCINATVRDFAKLGKLCLQQGQWEGRTVVPAEWMAKCTHPSLDGQTNYSYHFWLYQDGTYAANGYMGQYVFVNPKTNTIVVRMGRQERNVDWERMFYYLSGLEKY